MAATRPLGDAELVDAVRGGDDRAFGVLFDRYRDDLLRYVRRTQPKDTDQAEDILQDVFLSALPAMRSSNREIIFKPWIYRIAHNACIDRHRRGSRYASVSIDDDTLASRDESRLGDASIRPDTAVERRVAVESLRKALAGLDDPHHEILLMREFEGRSYEAIAKRMELSESAVQSTLFRARQRLKNEFTEISTGERCKRVQLALDGGGREMGTGRTRRRYMVHLRDCDECRRHAAVLGMSDLLAESAELPTLRAKLAALLPVMPLGFWRQLGAFGGGGSEPVQAGSGKLVAAALAATALAGGGLAAHQATTAHRDAPQPSSAARAASSAGTAGGAAAASNSSSRTSSSSSPVSSAGKRSEGRAQRVSKRHSSKQTPAAADPKIQNGSGARAPHHGRDTKPGLDKTIHDTGSDAGKKIGDTVDKVSGNAQQGAQNTIDGVQHTVDDVGNTVGNSGVPGGKQLGDTVHNVGNTVHDTGTKLNDTVHNTVGSLSGSK